VTVPKYLFDARLMQVVDGDTVRLFLDRGFSDVSKRKMRLYGVDTPEIFRGSDLEREAGGVASEFVRGWFGDAEPVPAPRSESYAEERELVAWPLTVETVKPSKYGDIMVRVWRKSDGRELAADLLSVGLARPYLGAKKKPWPTAVLEQMVLSA
jgi:endonuclease YncB( thermonuclease family)